MSQKKSVWLERALLGGAMLLGAGAAAADYGLNMTQGVTDVSHEVYHLHMLIFYICCAIAVVVFGAMFYSIWKHRKSVGHEAANFHESTTVEIVWTIIPFAILISMAIPATKALINLEDAADPDMTIKVTGYQWMWRYDYPEESIGYFSRLDSKSNEARQVGSGIDPKTVDNYLLNVDNPLVIPVGKKIRFLITSNDVIHSWWVRDLGWKKDAIPGYINEAWTRVEKPGVYRGQCAELCGKDHGFMPIVVVAKSQADYDAWVASKKPQAKNDPAHNQTAPSATVVAAAH